MKTLFKQSMFVAFILLNLVTMARAQNSKSNILIIHSYSRAAVYDWVNNMTLGIKTTLGNQHYNFYEYEMQTKTIPETDFENKANKAKDYFNQIHPKLVFLTDDNALRLMVPRLGKKIPIVFMGVNGSIRYDYPWLFGYPNVTGVLERPLLKRTILEMRKALGLKVKKALLLMGTSPTANAFFAYDLSGKDKFRVADISVDVHRTENFAEWRERILRSNNDGYDMLMIAAYSAMRDDHGQHIRAEDCSEWISQYSPLPMFTVHSGQVGKDRIIGGMIINGVAMGEDAAQIAQRILEDNDDPATILYTTQKRGELIFSKSQLKKRNLSVTPIYMPKVIYTD